MKEKGKITIPRFLDGVWNETLEEMYQAWKAKMMSDAVKPEPLEPAASNPQDAEPETQEPAASVHPDAKPEAAQPEPGVYDQMIRRDDPHDALEAEPLDGEET